MRKSLPIHLGAIYSMLKQKWGTVMTSTRTWNRRPWNFQIPLAALPTARRNRKFLSTRDSSSEEKWAWLLSKLFPTLQVITFPSESRIALGFQFSVTVTVHCRAALPRSTLPRKTSESWLDDWSNAIGSSILKPYTIRLWNVGSHQCQTSDWWHWSKI